MVVNGKLAEVTDTDPGVKRKMLGHGGSLMMTEVMFDQGAIGPMHSHPHEQVSYIAKGSFEFNLNGDISTVTVGDSIYIPSGVLHGTKAIEDGSIIIDVFTPQRDEFLSAIESNKSSER